MASFSGVLGRGIVTKKLPAGIITALDLRKPIFFGIVILPLSSISTTPKPIHPISNLSPTELKFFLTRWLIFLLLTIVLVSFLILLRESGGRTPIRPPKGARAHGCLLIASPSKEVGLTLLV